jgi:hypothetical protein
MNDLATSPVGNPTPARAPMRADGNRLWYDFETAEPFIDPATGAAPHCVEHSVTVYLRLDDTGRRWIVDGQTVDGAALDAYGDLHVSNCPCTDQAACSAVADAADKLPLPNAWELLHMLAAALDYPLPSTEGDRR